MQSSVISKCGTTMTGTRYRYQCFMKQLQASSLHIINALRAIFVIREDNTHDKRGMIDHCLTHNYTLNFTRFKTELEKTYPDMADIINTVLGVYTELMGMETIQRDPHTGAYIQYPIKSLWVFFIRTIYEKPRLLLPDNDDGDNVEYIRTSLENYVSEQVKRK
jgi:hypothetical protein